MTATAPLFPYTVLFLSEEGAVECSLVLAADAVAALGIAQARYAADAGPAAPSGGEDALAQDVGDSLPAAECLAVYPGHQIGVMGGVSPKPVRPAAGARGGGAPGRCSDVHRSRARAAGACPQARSVRNGLVGPPSHGRPPRPSVKAPPDASGSRVQVTLPDPQHPASDHWCNRCDFRSFEV